MEKQISMNKTGRNMAFIKTVVFFLFISITSIFLTLFIYNKSYAESFDNFTQNALDGNLGNFGNNNLELKINPNDDYQDASGVKYIFIESGNNVGDIMATGSIFGADGVLFKRNSGAGALNEGADATFTGYIPPSPMATNKTSIRADIKTITTENKTVIPYAKVKQYMLSIPSTQPGVDVTFVSAARSALGLSGDSFKTVIINNLDVDIVPSDSSSLSQSSCNIKGAIGWIVCPVITFMADIADKAYTFIEGRFLIIDGDLLAKDETINAWKAVQGVANIAFVIAFLIIILSQVTNFGISNYGIKKMLPKLVVAAILVNLSYIICQLGVDLSNMIGSSVNSFISNTVAVTEMKEAVGGGMPTSGGGGMISLTQKILIGGVGVGAFLLSLSALMPVLIGAIISCVMILFILVGRKALIVLLTVLSPLAFVAYMLPNTKSLFDKWQKAFVAMLMVYPIVAVVFAGSKLAARILMPADSNTDDGIMFQVIASSMSVIPLFVVPGLLKKSMDGVAGIGAAVSKMSSAASSGGKKGVAGAQKKYKESDYGKFRSTRKADIKSRVRSGNYEGSKLHFVKNAKSKARGAINDNKAFGMVTGGRGAALGAAAVKQDLSDRKEFTESMGGNEELYKAVANGAFDEDSTAFNNLTDENKIKIQKMKSSNLHRSASTYLATAEYMTANGLDDGDLSHNAIKEAGKHGADQGTRIAAYKAAEDANKKSGNFSALRKVHNHGHEYRLGFDVAYAAENTRNDQEMSYRDAILKVAPKDLSKYSFKGADSAQASAEYNAVLNDNSNYAAASVNQFSDMNAGTQDIVAPKITDAGQKLADKRANDIGYANAEQVVPRFSNPQQAKTHLQNNIPQPPATPPATPPTNHHYN